MHNFMPIFSYTFLTLLPMANPLGMSSVFLSLSENMEPAERHKLAYTVAIYSFVLLMVVLVFGPLILKFFGVSIPFIRMAGGFLVFVTAWQMLNAKSKLTTAERREARVASKDIAFFPLTMPITAGSGSIAIIVSMAAEFKWEALVPTLTQYVSATAAIFCVMIVVALCYRFSEKVFSKLGDTGTNVVTRLIAFILLAISLQLIWEGMQTILHQLK
jgi:multiple antibiotic resistance protein